MAFNRVSACSICVPTGYSVAGQPIDLSLYVRNALDKTYAAGGAVVTPSITSTTLIYGDPRMFGLELRYRFGE